MAISLTSLANLFFFVSLAAVGFYGVIMFVLCDQYVRAVMDSPEVDSYEVIEATPSILLLFSVSLTGSIVWFAVGGFCQTFA